ncbi:hypothetical protein EJ08DRAFT_684038 [Tothia fuscella]|uniref:Uncharacterized protein n=1 Tax=Tothia fuscella TaxID=1048955 RepID=A0A9P4TSM8_9PEZI|nr:hypothetical protein EJ08DRAFT_684038 [Tothia fuscella]
MAPSLQSLPNELKQLIIANIDPAEHPQLYLREISGIRALTNVRLVSKDLCHNATRSFNALFEHLTVHLQPRSFLWLAQIAAHEELRKEVKKLSVTIRCFSPSAAEAIKPPYSGRLNRRVDNLYTKCLEEQENSHTFGKNVDSLVNALRSFENCHTVSVNDDIGLWRGKSTRIGADVFNEVFRDSEFDHELEFNARVFSTLVEAMSFPDINVDTFLIECGRPRDSGNFFPKLFSPPSVMNGPYQAAFVNVQSLQLQIRFIEASSGNEDLSFGDTELTTFWHMTPRLEELSLSFDTFYDSHEAHWRDYLSHMLFDTAMLALKSLTISYLEIDSTILMGFLLRHGTTFLQLTLNTAVLENLHSWPPFLCALADSLALQRLEITGAHDKIYKVHI